MYFKVADGNNKISLLSFGDNNNMGAKASVVNEAQNVRTTVCE